MITPRRASPNVEFTFLTIPFGRLPTGQPSLRRAGILACVLSRSFWLFTCEQSVNVLHFLTIRTNVGIVYFVVVTARHRLLTDGMAKVSSDFFGQATKWPVADSSKIQSASDEERAV